MQRCGGLGQLIVHRDKGSLPAVVGTGTVAAVVSQCLAMRNRACRLMLLLGLRFVEDIAALWPDFVEARQMGVSGVTLIRSV